MFRTCLSFDMRSASFGTPHVELFQAALEMIEFADRSGIENVIISEHHASEDGYIPVPALLAAAAGARTSRIAITLGAIVLPLHDPVMVAEQIAVTDLICRGRLHSVLVAGYAHHEFAAFRKSMHDRGKAMDHGVNLIRRALSGERFQDGDREVFVRPLPPSGPHQLYVGGGVPAAARRAARSNTGFWPLQRELVPLYEEECRRLGRAPGPVMTTAVGVHIAEDTEAAWQEVGPYVLHQARAYASISADSSESHSPMHGLETLDDVRRAGILQVLTPDEAARLANGGTTIAVVPLLAGLPPEIGWRSLRLFVEKALPQIQTSPSAA
jgi:alkanesulfonate monooxygenase SsuD/methylene tetrahydromethanopterin reductase-like flavin-dependent oxidoreductase (luciferase family)